MPSLPGALEFLVSEPIATLVISPSPSATNHNAHN
jgi:hypothetical protein